MDCEKENRWNKGRLYGLNGIFRKFALASLLAAALCLGTGCGLALVEKPSAAENPAAEEAASEILVKAQVTAQTRVSELGEAGADYSFALNVTDAKGQTLHYLIHTDEMTAGDALLKLEVVDDSREPAEVNGRKADWEQDHAYWRILVDGEEWQGGMDEIELPGTDQLEVALVYTLAE